MLLIQVSLGSMARLYAKKAAILILTMALVIFAWTSVYFQANMNANAATLDGVGDRVEGTVEEYAGKVKRVKGDITNDLSEEMKGGLQEAKGKAKQEIGITKNKLDSAEDYVEEKSESLVDSVKDFFD